MFILSLMKQQKKNAEKQIDSLSRDLERLKLKKKKSLNLFIDEKISKKDYVEFVNDTNEHIHNTLSKIENLKAALETKYDQLALLELKQQLDGFVNFQELTPDILHRLIERIEIKAEGSENLLSILGPFCLLFN